MYDICNNEVFTMETTYSYLHRVQYYETDGMRIVHHANYIHWMEEARIAYMEEAGYGYALPFRFSASTANTNP